MKVVSCFAAALALANANTHDDHAGHNHDHMERSCGTVHDKAEIEVAVNAAARFKDKVCSNPLLQGTRLCSGINSANERRRPVTIPVWYHVISDGELGNLTDAQLQAQFDQTSKDFSGQEDQSIPGYVDMDIKFFLAGITRTDNAKWFSDITEYESEYKPVLAVDNTRNFNQYFGGIPSPGLGKCYFPDNFPEGSPMHGCMNLYSSVPGGTSVGYNEGKTTTHETGHGIGLFHTHDDSFFGSGCDARKTGDFVDDTCPQDRATNGCPAIAPKSCGLDCADPIHNYMSYASDTCMTQFTRGQNERANVQLAAFRPSLYLSDQEISLIEEHEPTAWDECHVHSKASGERHVAKIVAKYRAL